MMETYRAPDNRRHYDEGYGLGFRIGVLCGIGISLLISIIAVWR